MHIDNTLKDYLTKANLYFLLAKKYEYVDPQKHMYFYQKHFYYAQCVDHYYNQLAGQMGPHGDGMPHNADPSMYGY